MIFVDSMIPMYLIGSDASFKGVTQTLLERLVSERERLVTNAEVLQEILHRYAAMQRWQAIDDGFEVLLKVVEEVFPVDRRDAERAKDVLLNERSLSARDAIHVAVMQRHGITRIVSFDSSFDRVPGITRISS